MTISPWIIYLWGIADNLKSSLALLIALLGMASLLTTVYLAACRFEDLSEDHRKLAKSFARWVYPLFAFVVLVQILTPSSKTIAVMVILPAIVNSEPIQKDLPDMYRIAVDALKEQLAPEKK